VPITRQKSPVFSIVSLPTDSVIVDHAVFIYGTKILNNTKGIDQTFLMEKSKNNSSGNEYDVGSSNNLTM
jgi:hypothetical protein